MVRKRSALAGSRRVVACGDDGRIVARLVAALREDVTRAYREKQSHKKS